MLKSFLFFISGPVGGLLTKLLVLSFFIIANPFQILSATGLIAEKIALRSQSLLRDDPSRRSDVIAVIVDDASLSALATSGYPATFDFHARMLRTILCAGPSSVFVDIEFQAIRADAEFDQSAAEAVDALADALRTAPMSTDCPAPAPALSPVTLADMEREPRVFLARSRPQTGDECKLMFDGIGNACSDHALMAAVRDAATALTITTSAPEKRQLHYPLIAGPSNTGHSKATAVDRRAVNGDTGLQPSPALALVLERCRQRRVSEGLLALCDRMQALLDGDQDVSSRGETTLIPAWRYYVDVDQPWFQLINTSDKRDADHPCRMYQFTGVADGEFGSVDRLMMAAKALWTGVLNDIDTPGWLRGTKVFDHVTCNPYPSISAFQLQQQYNRCLSSAGCDALLHELFAGRSVVYGYDVVASKDSFYSPVIGVISGLFFHVAAADNLIHLADGYMREARQLSVLDIEIDSNILELALLCFAFAMTVLFVSIFRDAMPMILKLTLMLSLFASSIMLPFWLHFAPFDWIAVIVGGSIIIRSRLWKQNTG